MKTIDLRQQAVTLDELFQAVGDDVVRVTSRDGEEFILEAADAFEREAAELGRSEVFLTFLAERSAEPGRTPLADIEARVAAIERPPASLPDHGQSAHSPP